jgi:hypothetical protein
MKLNKLMFAAVAFGALTFVACNKQGDTPVGPVGPVGPGGGDDPEPEVEIPEVAAPGAGKATIVIQIPEGTECNGIAFKGTLDGAAWSGENTYVGEGTAAAGPDACIKFEKIADTKVWYKATYTLGEAGLKGKICLIYTNDGSWQGQAVNWEIIDDYTTADNGQSNDGNLEIYGEGLVYVKIGGWQNSECLVPEDYKITVIVPEFCDGEFDIELNMNDIRKDTFCSSGPGGQGVNTTYSAVRLTHIPSGIVVQCQEERSQLKNLDRAMEELRTRLYNMEHQKYLDGIAAKRKTMVSTGDRSAKIRTYNYPQGRVTDHRIGYTIYNLPAFMDGDIQDCIDHLIVAENAEKLKQAEL